MRYILIAYSVATILFNNGAQSQNLSAGLITGYVFDDTNNNGSKEENEKGIKDAVVSNQVDVARTDERGFYTISYAPNYDILFVSVPSGYKAKAFWRRVESPNTDGRANFALTRMNSSTSFTFIHASDTHVSETSVDRMDKFRAIVDSVKPSLVLITGDLVRDALRVTDTVATRLYQLFKQQVERINFPVWPSIGNHEIFGIERHLSLVSDKHPLYGFKMYMHYLGPDYYSFNYGGVHFVSLNSLEFEDLWYYGRIDSVQLEWLKKDVALVPPATPIVTFQHIPLYSGGFTLLGFQEDGPGKSLVREHGVLQYRHVVSNARAVLAILQSHNYPLALAGHYHFQSKFSLEGCATRFEQTAAVVAPANDGVFNLPSGVTVYHVKDGKIDDGKFVRLDK